jgi:hypothetical protein
MTRPTGRDTARTPSQGDPIDIAHLEFHRTILRSPAGTRYLVDDGGYDSLDQPYVLLRRIGEQGRPTSGRRRRLRADDAAGWTLAQAAPRADQPAEGRTGAQAHDREQGR